MKILLCCLFGAVSVCGLTIDSPEEFARHVVSPIYNQLTGSQNASLRLTGPALYSVFGECGNPDFDQSLFVGKIVVLVNLGNPQAISGEERVAICLQQAGAIAVVRSSSAIVEPGMSYYWNDRALRRAVTVPYLHVAKRDVLDVIEALEIGTNITLTLTVDDNPWRTEMFDTVQFLIFMRIFLAIINLMAMLISIDAAIGHLRRLFFSKTQFTSATIKGTVRVMAGGSSTQIIASAIRGAYCAIGPIISTSKIYFEDHIFLIYMPFAFDMLTTLVAVALFLRWGAFGTTDSFLKRHLDGLLLAVAFLYFLLFVLLAIFHAYHVSNLVAVVLFAALFEMLCLAVIGFVFVFVGIRFIGQLRESIEIAGSQSRSKSLRKATRWIILSGVALLLQIVGSALGGSYSVVYSARGHFVVFAFFMSGGSLTGLAHSLALRPISADTRPKLTKPQSAATVSPLD
eukprot:c8200_g1_i2.p1 GENE.c8200_g1_i2~~c8200_g1_i2.p1  ORF type:complete len:457 (+),score=108.30 c8200_g1_i2:37-1407(+)